jgi:predicted ATPase
MQDALTLARSLGDPLSLLYACHFAAGLHQWRREPRAVRELDDAARAQTIELGFRPILLEGEIQRGWLLAADGRAAEGLAQMRDGVTALRDAGMELRIPGYLALMADVNEKIGQPAQGLAAVSQALDRGEERRQPCWDAELYRLKGALSLQTETGPGQPRRRMPSRASVRPSRSRGGSTRGRSSCAPRRA